MRGRIRWVAFAFCQSIWFGHCARETHKTSLCTFLVKTVEGCDGGVEMHVMWRMHGTGGVGRHLGC